jgi:putative membrane-bound dehydrogenase-like protein
LVSIFTMLLGAIHGPFLCRADGLPKVPDGFQIRLVAAVPAVQYPCQVATAPDGALFVAEDPMDQVGPADKPGDRILVFPKGARGEDPVVFADKLNAVFGMIWHDGSLFVMNMPNLTVLRDTDGDGKADQRKELFTDLGVPAGQPNMFNDHIVSGLQIGIDGYLYISVGDKGVPMAHGPDGRTAQIRGGGILRCRLDGKGLEVFSTGTRNHLEPNLDAADNLFTYDNTDDGLGWWTRVTHHIDGGYYGYPWDYHTRKDRMLDRMAEYGGGSPCGGVFYREDAWPEKYQGRGFWAEWGQRKVRAFKFKPKGATFEVDDVIDFIQPDKVSDFRPLDLALSYDGKTMYVADWGYGGWNNKSEKLGRVYAVEYTGEIQPGRPRGKDTDSIEEQIKQLDHPSYNERVRAQWVLIKIGPEVVPPVTRALANPETSALAKRHLVWILNNNNIYPVRKVGPVDFVDQGVTVRKIGPVDFVDQSTGLPVLIQLLESPTADVRAQALRALGLRKRSESYEPIRGRLKDADPTVRLQAVIALDRVANFEDVIPLVADSDPYIAYSARKAIRGALATLAEWIAAEALHDDFRLYVVPRTKTKLATNLTSALKSANPKVRTGVLLALEMTYDPVATEAMATFATDPARDPSERARALFLLAQGHRKPIPWDLKWWGTQPANTKPPAKTIDWAGTPLVLKTVRDLLSDSAEPVRLAAIKAEVDIANDPEALPILRARFEAERVDALRAEVAKALGKLHDKAALPMLVAALRDPKSPGPVIDASLGSVEAIGSDEALKALLDLLQTGTLGEERTPRVVSALGRFKASIAGDALASELKNPTAAVRAAAAEALGSLGKNSRWNQALREVLNDPSPEVRRRAMGSFARLRDTESIPALVTAANDPETRFEAALALTAMPDVRAVSIYLRGLTDKSPDLRKASSSALTSIRDEASPYLEKLSERKELPSTALPELRKIYSRVRPVERWQVLGPLPIEAVPPFAIHDPIDLKASYTGFQDRPIHWRTARAVDKQGQIDLGKLYDKSDDDIAAYAFAEVSSPSDRKAELRVGSDDTLTVWLNDEKVYDFQNRRGFTAEESHVDVPMVKGTNRLLVKCGNRGGGWQFSVAVSGDSEIAFLKGPAPGTFDPETYRSFAMKTKGQVDHGKALFSDLKGLACIKCHAVGGQGGTVGPELASVGAKYPKDELIQSVLYPSSKISSGYEPVVIATSDGRVLTGILKSETGDALEIEDVDAKRIKIAKDDVDDRKKSDISLMPNGLAEGLSQQDFADLIAYLETLKEVKPAGTEGR